jgi:L-ascorbate metabolism protein UlaG (beta-lactamase superfamily)
VNASPDVILRWLGAAGLELRAGGETLLIDPYVTRIPFQRLWFGRARPNQALIAQTLPQATYVLVTHAHFDHLMDVPDVLGNTGAVAYGSPNAGALLKTCGVPQSQIRRLALGARLDLGAFTVRVLPAEHMRTPGFGPGPLKPNLAPPLRAHDYCYDAIYSFWVSLAGWSLLIDPGGLAQPDVRADVICVGPHREAAYYAGLAARLQPRVMIPIHWDNMFRPLAQPLRPYHKPPNWTRPPFQRLDLAQFRRTVERAAPGVRVFVPDVLLPYGLAELVGTANDAST